MPGQRGVDEGGVLGDMSNQDRGVCKGWWGRQCAEVITEGHWTVTGSGPDSTEMATLGMPPSH